MTYEITGGEDDGKKFDIAFKKCNEADWDSFSFKTSKNPSQRKQAVF